MELIHRAANPGFDANQPESSEWRGIPYTKNEIGSDRLTVFVARLGDVRQFNGKPTESALLCFPPSQESSGVPVDPWSVHFKDGQIPFGYRDQLRIECWIIF